MVCAQCGTEFYEGVFCPECGTKYSLETEKKPNIERDENQFDQQNQWQENNIQDDVDTQIIDDTDIKVPWYFQMWFISLIFWIGSMVCVGSIAAIVLFTLRITKYPNARKKAWISAGIQLGICAIIVIIALI